MRTLSNPDTGFSNHRFEEAYPAGIERHFWQRARNIAIEEELRAVMQRLGLPSATLVMEVGCGPGIVVAHLRRAGFVARGVDQARPLPLAEAAEYVDVGMDAAALPDETRAAVGVVLLLDVIEHIEHPAAFLRLLREAFPNARAFVVSVPARPEVWSNYDEHFGHFRRYTASRLSEDLKRAGLVPGRSRPLFALLYVVALVLAISKRKRRTEQRPPSLLPVHGLLVGYFATEAKLLRLLPFVPGLSLIVSAACTHMTTTNTPPDA